MRRLIERAHQSHDTEMKSNPYQIEEVPSIECLGAERLEHPGLDFLEVFTYRSDGKP